MSRKCIVIVGGGITGLSAAYRLKELVTEKSLDLEIILLEPNEGIGGSIETYRKDGYLIDTGPDNFVTYKPGMLNLVKRLGLEDELIKTSDKNQGAMVVRKGKPLPIPEGFLLMAPTKIWPIITTKIFSWPGKIRMGMEYFIKGKKENPDESLESFVVRRFGRECLDRLVQPLLGGIYTADPAKLSLRTTVPRFLDLETKYGSLIKGMRKEAKGKKEQSKDRGARYSMFMTFKEGMQTLVGALQEDLGSIVRTNTKLISAKRNEDKTWELELEGGEKLTADGILLSCPTYQSGSILSGQDSDLSGMLSSIEYASSVVINFGFKREQIANPLTSFGFVVPKQENKSIIAGSFSSIKYANRAPDGKVLIRAFLGGALNQELLKKEDDELIRLALDDLNSTLGINGEPEFSIIKRHNKAMPQYEVGHLERVEKIKNSVSKYQGLGLAGNGFGGVGMPDCITMGEKTIEQILESVKVS